MSKLPLLLILMVLCFACTAEEQQPQSSQTTSGVEPPQKYDSLKNITAYPADAEAPFDVTFTKQVVFGETEEVLLENILQFAVDDLGQVFLVNGRSIEVFNANGEYVKTLGGDGRGPGEFNNMTYLKPKIKDQKLYAYDDVLKRVNVFNTTTLELFQTIYIEVRLWSHIPELRATYLRDFQVVNDSLLLFQFQDSALNENEESYFKRYYLLDHQQGSILQVTFKYELHIDNRPILFRADGKTDWPFPNASGRYTRIAFDHNNNIYETKTDDFFIKVYSPSGEYERAIYYPYENSPLDPQEIINTYDYNETVAGRAEDYEYPDTWPAIDYVFVDDEKRIWVATITGDTENYEWWVLENDGQLLARFKWPGNRLERIGSFRVHPKVKNGFWYVKETDPTTEISQIVKYKIEFTERK